LSFVILLPSCNIELICSGKPIEYLNFSFSGTHEQHILTEIVLNHYRTLPPLFKYLEQFEILLLSGHKEWAPPFIVRYHAKLWLMLKDLLGELDIFLDTSHMQCCITMYGILRSEVDMLLKFKEEGLKHL
jgi:hypothetical protein